MALNWLWSDKFGELEIEQKFDDKTEEWKLCLYEGNALLIMLYEYEENGHGMYTMWNFFDDKTHMKRCLGLEKGYGNIFTEHGIAIKKLRLNRAKNSKWKDIVTAFAQAFDDITIEMYNEA